MDSDNLKNKNHKTIRKEYVSFLNGLPKDERQKFKYIQNALGLTARDIVMNLEKISKAYEKVFEKEVSEYINSLFNGLTDAIENGKSIWNVFSECENRGEIYFCSDIFTGETFCEYLPKSTAKTEN